MLSITSPENQAFHRAKTVAVAHLLSENLATNRAGVAGKGSALTSLRHGRLLLAGFHYLRNPIALPRLQKMILAAEARLGRQPRRRPKLIKKRLKPIREKIKQRQRWLQAQLDRKRALLEQIDSLPGEVGRLEKKVAAMEARYQAEGREIKPYSRLAQAQRRLASARKKLDRLSERLQQAEQVLATHWERLDELQAEYYALKVHQAQLEADNAANPEPVNVIARLDAGFGSDPNVTRLIEMGYIVCAKALSTQVAALPCRSSFRCSPRTLRWAADWLQERVVHGSSALD